MFENVLECSLELLKDYHGKTPAIKRDRCFKEKK